MKTIYKVGIVVYAIVFLVVFNSMVNGKENYLTTAILYSFLLAIVLLPVYYYEKRSNKKLSALKTNLITIVITLFVADLALRYVLNEERYLTYTERNGASYYYSNTLKQKFNKIRRRGTKNGWIYVNTPNATNQSVRPEYSYQHRYNSEGLRNEEVPLNKKPSEYRIITFGDSFTEGAGAPADSTWSFLLGKFLQQKGGDTLYNVISAGSNGSDPVFESYLLKYRMLKYKPDMVIVAMNNSDIDDVVERGGYERFQSDSTYRLKDSPWWEPVYGASMIYRMVVRNVFHYTYALVPESEEQLRKAEAKQKLVEALNYFNTLAKQNNFQLVLILHPTLWELQNNLFPFQPVADAAVKNEIPVLNLYKEFHTYFASTQADPKQYYWEKDLHNNSKGYLLWSEIAYQKLFNGQLNLAKIEDTAH